jgi:hypothetical protein
MDLRANMVSDESNDPFAIGSGEILPGITQPTRQPVDPQPAIRIEHHLDNGWVFEPRGYGRSERGTQHARTTQYRFRLKGLNRHCRPRHTVDRNGRSV